MFQARPKAEHETCVTMPSVLKWRKTTKRERQKLASKLCKGKGKTEITKASTRESETSEQTLQRYHILSG